MKYYLFGLTLTLVFTVNHCFAKDNEPQHKHSYFDKMDLNQDGAISEDEYLAQAKKKFSKIDIDHNSQLSLEELKQHKMVTRKKRRDQLKEKLTSE